VAVGEGQIQWAEVLNAAHKIGVKHYFLEDETVMPLKSIPDSFKYLRALKL
jgi:sugar phosphate isomerase/epimerase